MRNNHRDTEKSVPVIYLYARKSGFHDRGNNPRIFRNHVYSPEDFVYTSDYSLNFNEVTGGGGRGTEDIVETVTTYGKLFYRMVTP